VSARHVTCAAPAWVVASIVAVAACSPETPTPNVPGPTVAKPDDLRPAPPAPVAPTRVALKGPDARVVSIRIAFAAGSADDPTGKEGLTQLTATTMAEGGTQALSYAELSSKLYPLAASIDVHIDRDETVFSAQVPRGVLDKFYPLLRDVILTPRFDADSFARLRARQTSELTSDLRGSSDEELGKEALESMLYEGHPYGHPTEGTEHGLAAITLEDVHAQYTSAFCRDRVTFGVAGGYADGFDDTVAADIAKLPACAAERAKLPDPPARHGFQLLVVDKPGAGATAISIGFTTPVARADEADYPGLLFATDTLGIHRQFSGRMFKEIRGKRGLNYGDYAYSEFFEQDGYNRFARPNIARRQQFVSIWIRPVKPANATFTLRAALSLYTKLVTDGVGDDELARMKEFLSRMVGLEQQTDSRRLGYAMDDRTYGLDAPYMEVMRRGWKDLDAAKLKAIMTKVLDTKNLSIAIVGSNGQKLADELLKGDPSTTPVYDSPKPPEVQAEDKDIAAFPVPLDPKAVRVVPVASLFK
jgi:zinc protease